MPRKLISAFIIALALSLATQVQAQKKEQRSSFLKLEKDSVPFFRGFAVSVDLVGPLMMQLGDYGQYEGALRLNLHDQFFPTVEIGYGKANHDQDINTGITYKTSAPYGRIGIDVNVLKRKHTGNRAFVGLRYGYSNFKVDIFRETLPDPVWQWDSQYSIVGDPCQMHWLELLFGVDAKVFGPLHLGWTARAKKRLFHKEGDWGEPWYVPGFGLNGSIRLGGTFNVIIDI